jgi:hypothetical protein
VRLPDRPSRAAARAESRPAARGRSSRPAQEQFLDGREAGVGAGQFLGEGAGDGPPVAHGGAAEGLQGFGERRAGGAAGPEEGGDGGGAQELEGGLPEVVGGVVALPGRLGVVGPAVQLRQRQGQPQQQAFVGGRVRVHLHGWAKGQLAGPADMPMIPPGRGPARAFRGRRLAGHWGVEKRKICLTSGFGAVRCLTYRAGKAGVRLPEGTRGRPGPPAPRAQEQAPRPVS